MLQVRKQQGRTCAFTNKASTPNNEIVKACGATMGDAAYMIKCTNCNGGGGSWCCVACIVKMQEALLAHGGDDGRKFRGLHRLDLPELKAVLEFPWRQVLQSGEVSKEQLKALVAHRTSVNQYDLCPRKGRCR